MTNLLTQETFLGCSIRSFNFNIGWGNSASVLNVGLVEDDALFQQIGLVQVGNQSTYFDPRDLMGQLVQFKYQNWYYDGILTNLYEIKSDSGNRVWEANISDPRELLDGVQVILGGYNGYTYGVPNVYNVYGYLESFGFGYSESIDSGIPWYKAMKALVDLINQYPIKLAGVPFFLDISSLPTLPSYYRIAGNNNSLLGLIQEICEAANFDFTCVLIGNTIKVICIDRNLPYLPGAITRMLGAIGSDFVEMKNGLELKYNTTNKFLVGSQVEEVYCQFNNIGPNLIGLNGKRYNPTYDDTISRFWGLDIYGNAITAQRAALSTGANQHFANEVFLVDGRAISYPGIAWYYYPMDISELRAAIHGRDSWEFFLILNDIRGSIHEDKATRLKLRSDMKPIALNGNIDIKHAHITDIVQFDRNQFLNDQHEAYLEKVYQFVHNFATQYMGTKFMVRIPFVYARNDTFSGQVSTSLEPTESGYLDESLFNQAVANGLMPDFTDFVTDSDGKITSYVRFGPFEMEELDLSDLSEDDFYITGQYLFVKCDVDPKIIYLNRATGYSPRVVITLRGAIKFTNEADILNLLEGAYINDSLIKGFNNNTIGLPPASNNNDTRDKKLDDFFAESAAYKAAMDFNRKNAIDIAAGRLPAAQTTAYGFFAYFKVLFLKNEFLTWKKQVGAEYAFLNIESPTLIPSMAVIPLKNNRLVYGPWYTNGYEGKAEFDQNFDLNPWTFGGFNNMNQVGQAIVGTIYTNTMIDESGSITIPGTPEYQLIPLLTSSGPMVTQIDVSVGSDGVTTTYSFGRWNATYGKQLSENVENFKKIYKIKREQARAFRALFKPKTVPFAGAVRFGTRALPKIKPRRIKPHTTHSMIMCSIFDDENGRKQNNIGMVPYYHVQNIADGDWTKIAGATIDTIFRPYSTDTKASGIAKFVTPSGAYNGISVNDYHPFNGNFDYQAVIRGPNQSGIDITKSGDKDTYRAIGLKTPMVLVGWGQDVNGGTVSSPSDSQDKWKAGPLDVVWDENRGVWTGNPIQIYEGILATDITPGSMTGPTTFRIQQYIYGGATSGYISIAAPSGNLTLTNRDPSLSVKLVKNSTTNYSGKILVVGMKINNEIRPIWVGCPELIK